MTSQALPEKPVAPQTPVQPPSEPPTSPPGAPIKHRSRAQTWAQIVCGMQTMPVEDAKKLKPDDIGVCMAPFMLTEEEMEEYRRHRANVCVLGATKSHQTSKRAGKTSK